MIDQISILILGLAGIIFTGGILTIALLEVTREKSK